MTDLLSLFQQFHREKLAMLLCHEAGARLVGQYDINNTYQYIINREEVQLSWLEAAMAELGGSVACGPEPHPTITERALGEKGAHTVLTVFREDARDARAFVARWRSPVEAMSNARHRGMLRVVLGETLEHERFFEQAAAGRTDLLGRRAEELGPPHGEVLPTRWVE